MTRIALIGLGKVAEDIHLPALAAVPGLALAGACDPDHARRERTGARFGVRALYATAAELLARERPEVAIVGAPPDAHRDLCLLALEHGAHVFCEKPFVRTVAEADEVLAAAARHRRQVAVNNQYRYMDIYRVPRERLAAGEFGRLFFVQVWQQMFHPPSHERNWRARLTESTLFEFGTHALDLACGFFDALPVAVSAHMPRVRADVAADVVVHVTLRFPGERLATLSFNRLSHAPERYLEMRLDCERASLRISLGGVARAAIDWSRTLGRPTARLSLVRGGEARVEAGGRSRVVARERRPAFASATARHLREFVAALDGGAEARARLVRARELIRVVAAGYESARTGETIWLHEPAQAAQPPAASPAGLATSLSPQLLRGEGSGDGFRT